VNPSEALQFVGTDGAARLFVYQGIQDARANAEYRVPRDAFGHTDPTAIVRLEARLADGAELPRWLSFDSVSGIFKGVPPPGQSGEVEVILMAKDREGREASVQFRLEMGVADDAQTGQTGSAEERFILGDGETPAERAAEAVAAKVALTGDRYGKAVRQVAKRAAAPFAEQLKASRTAKDPVLAKVLEAKAKPKTSRL
jgi:hypothetical protein